MRWQVPLASARVFIFASLSMFRDSSSDRTGMSLRRDRVAACKQLGGYAQASHSFINFVGSFRTNPLPEAFLPLNATATPRVIPPALLPLNSTFSTPRVKNMTEYVWTLFPYFFGSCLFVVLLLIACPCCCAFICLSKVAQRSPSPRVPGIAFNLTFAFLALVILLHVIVAVIVAVRGGFAYSRAKCALYTTLDTLVNGAPSDQQPLNKFIGFRSLKNTITSASATFPDVAKNINAMGGDAVRANTSSQFVGLAQGFYTSWSKSNKQAMDGTSYRCSLCGSSPLQPVISSIGGFRNASALLQRLLYDAKSAMDDTGPAVKSMKSDLLPDISALHRSSFSYASSLQTFVPWWERWWFACVRSMRFLLAGIICCLLIGLLAIFACRTEACAFCAWWVTYLHTLAFFIFCGLLLPTTVAVHDAAGLLRSVVTDPGMEMYRPRLFPNLTSRQGAILSSCINSGGSLRLSVNFSIIRQAQRWQALNRTTQQFRAAALNTSSLKAFFGRYGSVGGGSFYAAWNSSQTLGWDGEPNGVNVIARKLQQLSGEHWAFHNANPPLGCAMAMPFDATSATQSFSCFFVTGSHPTTKEAGERYATLARNDLLKLQSQFQMARATAQALSLAQTMSTRSGLAVPKLRDEWNRSVSAANKLRVQALAGVVVPLQRFSSRVDDLNSGGHCDSVRASYLAGIEALGRDFVAAHLVVTACFGIIAICSVGLTVLYCLLWSIRQQGRNHGFQPLPKDDYPDIDDAPFGDASVYDRDEMELELIRPLKKTW